MVKFKNKKIANILVDRFNCDWVSKTTAINAGTNLKDIIGLSLWNEITKPANKNKYFIRALFGAEAEGTAFQESIESYNILNNSSQKVYFFGSTTFTYLKFSDPANGSTNEGMIMINSSGDVRFYVKFGGTLNSNFKIDKFEIHEVL